MRKFNRRHVKGYSMNEGVGQLIQQPLEIQQDQEVLGINPQPTLSKFEMNMMQTNMKLDKNSEEIRKVQEKIAEL